jgi:hypothetical protein
MLISKLKSLAKVILETDTGVLYQLVVVDPEHSLVQISCGDPACRLDPPRVCKVLGAEVGHTIEPTIQKDRRLVIRFADVDFVLGPIVSAFVEGAGWHYDPWGQQ